MLHANEVEEKEDLEKLGMATLLSYPIPTNDPQIRIVDGKLSYIVTESLRGQITLITQMTNEYLSKRGNLSNCTPGGKSIVYRVMAGETLHFLAGGSCIYHNYKNLKKPKEFQECCPHERKFCTSCGSYTHGSDDCKIDNACMTKVTYNEDWLTTVVSKSISKIYDPNLKF